MASDTLSMYYDEDITINLEVLLGELVLKAEPTIIIQNFVLDYLILIEKIDIYSVLNLSFSFLFYIFFSTKQFIVYRKYVYR